MNKFLIVCTFLVIAIIGIHTADGRHPHKSSKNKNHMGGGGEGLDNFSRHIGIYFARKIVMQKLSAGALCRECKAVVDQLHSLVAEPGVEQELEEIVEAYVCPSMASMQQLCDDFVKEELPMVFSELEAALANSQAFCQSIGFCKARQQQQKHHKKVANHRRPSSLNENFLEWEQMENNEIDF